MKTFCNFIPFPTLSTQRLILRQLTGDDKEAIFALRSDEAINKYLDRPTCNSVDEANDFINKVNENVNANKAVYWAIILSDINKLVGTICLFGFNDESNNCEIGYELLPAFQQKGIMKEAVESVINYAFDTIKVQKIEAFIHRDNIQSIKLLQKLLFIQSNKKEAGNDELVHYQLMR